MSPRREAQRGTDGDDGLLFEPHEDRNARSGGDSCGCDCGQAFFSSEDEDRGSDRIPEPAITSARGADGPEADPARGMPPVYAAHRAGSRDD